MTLDEFASADCTPLKGHQHALDRATVDAHLQALDEWQLASDGGSIGKAFAFADFHRTMAFVNAVAWIAHQQDHHPDFEVGYARCILRYSTHDVGGLSLNDFICAAKVERLLGHG